MGRVLELALIGHAVGIDRDTLALDDALNPVALVGTAIGVDDLTLTIRHAFLEVAGIFRAIRELGLALALNDAFDPFAGVLIAVRCRVGALTVLFAVLELALINSAAVIFLGGGVSDRCLCLSTSGDCQTSDDP